MTWALQIAPLLIAGVSLILSSFFAARSLSRSASAEYVEQLEKRVSACEADRVQLRDEAAQLRREVSELRDREIYLMRELVKREGR